MAIVDIKNPKNYKKTFKLPIKVKMSVPAVGTKIHNHLERVDYVTDYDLRFVLSGTVDEKWCVTLKQVQKAYTAIDGSEITEEWIKSLPGYNSKTGVLGWIDILSRGDATTRWACHFTLENGSTDITTSWGAVLKANDPMVKHGEGDFIICADAGGKPDFSDMWVVNGMVFPTTYDMSEIHGGRKPRPKPLNAFG